jgi:uncharacterized membrane protein
MSLAPLLNASPTIQVHAFAAMAAFALGVVQLSAPKGTLPHRAMGFVWGALMLDDVTGHRRTMSGLFTGALVVAGIFPFYPGRIMHAVVFGH